jgi:hypothetical protein
VVSFPEHGGTVGEVVTGPVGGLILGEPLLFVLRRRKRNEIDYSSATIATTTEADELLAHAKSFLKWWKNGSRQLTL